LAEHPFRELTAETVMARTGLSRQAFYAYFQDRYDLATRLLEGIGALLFAVDRAWLEGAEETRDEARASLSEALKRGSEAFLYYGPVLKAISDAASQDTRVEEVYRFGLIENFVNSVAKRIERDVQTGMSPADLDPDETAKALVLLTERYLLDAFGRPQSKPSEAQIATVASTLERAWINTLYGS
jgi:AcrR family transcriptional regulator